MIILSLLPIENIEEKILTVLADEIRTYGKAVEFGLTFIKF